MSEITEDYSDNESQIDSQNEEMTETLDTEDVVDTTELQDMCDIVNMMNERKPKEILVVEDSKRISKNQMTKYELVRILGERTAQLTRGAKPLIKQNKKTDKLTYKEIAIEEIKLNMIPLKIKRMVLSSTGYQYEIWSVNELRKDHLMNILN